MSWFRLKWPVATNINVDVQDIVNTKMALNRLGYYRRPSEGYFGDWVDSELFNGIRHFQQDNGLLVDGLMRPGGPTEDAINRHIRSAMIRPTSLSLLERPAMCSCSSSDDNPWPT